MKRLNSVRFVLSLSVIVSLMIPFLAFAHSGRTDANGGHYNRKTGEYHYHGGGPARATAPDKGTDPQKGSVPSGTSSGSKAQEQGGGKTDQQDTTVYVTRTGSKYHNAGCSYLKSSIPMKLSEAGKKYTPCSKCNPPKTGGQVPAKQSTNDSSVSSTEKSAADTRGKPDAINNEKGSQTWTDADGTTHIAIKGSESGSGTAVGITATGKTIYEGPRGGRYHYSSSGKKVYERKR